MKKIIGVLFAAVIGFGFGFGMEQMDLSAFEKQGTVVLADGMRGVRMNFVEITDEQQNELFIDGGVHPHKLYLKKTQVDRSIQGELYAKDYKIKVVPNFVGLENGQELTVQGIDVVFVKEFNEIWVLETASNDSLMFVINELL